MPDLAEKLLRTALFFSVCNVEDDLYESNKDRMAHWLLRQSLKKDWQENGRVGFDAILEEVGKEILGENWKGAMRRYEVVTQGYRLNTIYPSENKEIRRTRNVYIIGDTPNYAKEYWWGVDYSPYDGDISALNYEGRPIIGLAFVFSARPPWEGFDMQFLLEEDEQ